MVARDYDGNSQRAEGNLRILVIGSGGREHALCWRLAAEQGTELFATPGNPGMAQVATCVPAGDPLAIAESLNIDLTVVGPEAPLAEGIVDRFRAAGRGIVGPTQAAARLESSKVFTKEFLHRHGIPTARHVAAQTPAQALDALRDFKLPVVLKTDGLAAGKGVIIARTQAEAEDGIAPLMASGAALVIEEFLEGEEASFIVLSDGEHVIPFEASQDHKAVFDGDQGPNTGGMGAYSDGRILTRAQSDAVMQSVIYPAIEGMRREGTPFTGFLYAGLMMTSDGAKVLEFNVRLGDPEAQALLHRMDGGLVEALEGASRGGGLRDAKLAWKPAPSVCVVLAAAGYPGTPQRGDLIHGLDEVTNAVVFQAGTEVDLYGIKTAGGRVLGVTASGPDLARAIGNAYAAVSKIHFDGMHYRRDIGHKGLKRWQGGERGRPDAGVH